MRYLLVFAFLLIALPASAMTAPMISNQNFTQVTNANNNQFYPYSASGATSRTSDNGVRNIIGVAGTIQNLYVTLTSAPGVGKSFIFTLFKNGVADNVTCTIQDTATSCTDVANSTTVTAGDTLSWKQATTSNPTLSVISISSTFTGTASGEAPILNTNFTPSNSVTNYFSLNSPIVSTIEASSSSISPINGTIDNLYAEQDTGPGVGKSNALTLYQNGSPTSLTCTISGLATTCTPDTNPAHAVTIVPTDKLSIQTVPTGTPTARATRYSVRFRPTTDGEYPLFANRLSTIPFPRFYQSVGSIAQSTTESATQLPIPLAFVARSLYIAIDVTPNAAHTYTYISRVGATNGALTCQIGSGSLTCSDITHSETLAFSNLYNFNQTATAGTTAYNSIKTGFVAFIAPPAATSGIGTVYFSGGGNIYFGGLGSWLFN